MQQKSTILSQVKGSVATLTLNRPDIHNALNINMIRELTDSFKEMESRDEIRIILLNANGLHFCSGADLNWMKEGLNQTPAQLKSESLELANLFRTFWTSDLIILSAVQGKVIGGANGLLSSSDIVVAEETASFTLPEVKLGLVPATIAPYLVHKMGFSKSAEIMLSGRTFDATEAKSAGLVHYLCEAETLKETVESLVADLLTNGPDAMKEVKGLLRWLGSGQITNQIHEHSAELIARVRTSSEGQEGMNAFFQKRKPGWDETT